MKYPFFLASITKRSAVRVTVLAILFLFGVLSCSGDGASTSESMLVIYSGRSQSLVAPIIKRFETDTGIHVRIKYGKSAQLVLTLEEEGERSPADLFWSQDAGALGAMCTRHRFATLPQDVVRRVPERFRHDGSEWVGTSGRARVFAYSPTRVAENERPQSVLELTDARWKGRVGWAPLNASFQSFVTAMRRSLGEQETREWLMSMKANDAQAYPKNTAIIEAISAGEVDLGLPNHYYLLRFKNSDADYPVEQDFFEAGDIGNLVNVAGVGVLKNAENYDEAIQFLNFLLSPEIQQYFVDKIFEYPVSDHKTASERLTGIDELIRLAPNVRLSDLEELDATLKLLRETGLL